MSFLLGWLGAGFILFSYFRKKRRDLHLTLAVGCLFLLVYSLLIGDLVFTVLNLCMLVANLIQAERTK